MEIKQHYSIIIPIYNEFKFLPELISGLKIFYHQGHEVVIVDDGSTDGSKSILEGCNFINLIKLPKNQGKGIAIKVGIQEAINERIVLFDGDLELDLDEISKLFILNRNKKVYSAMGYRFNHLNPFKSSFHWGNFMFTTFFNILHSFSTPRPTAPLHNDHNLPSSPLQGALSTHLISKSQGPRT